MLGKIVLKSQYNTLFKNILNQANNNYLAQLTVYKAVSALHSLCL